jgi:tRNA A-37 threonylcarbamoyl transferase component Bud32
VSLILWHLAGRPAGWGLEQALPVYRKVSRNGYTWFLAGDADIPAEAAHPGQFMERFSENVLNRSRTTFVKTGVLEGRQIYLKRYNFKGAKDSMKNLFRKGRARMSFEGALMLSHCHIPTPRVVFACEKRVFGLLLDSYIATESVEARDLVEHVAGSGYDRALILSLARLMRRIHEMGFVPVDLKGENILTGKEGFYLIDLDRLRRIRWPGLKTIAKNLSYLNASFSRTIPHHDREAFLEEYIKGSPWLQGKKGELAGMIKELTEKRIRERY